MGTNQPTPTYQAYDSNGVLWNYFDVGNQGGWYAGKWQAVRADKPNGSAGVQGKDYYYIDHPPDMSAGADWDKTPIDPSTGQKYAAPAPDPSSIKTTQANPYFGKDFGGGPTTKTSGTFNTDTMFNNWGNRPQAPTPPLAGPGEGEQWWDTHKDWWNQPTKGSQYWNGVQGYFTGPNESEDYLRSIGKDIAKPGAMSDAWGTAKTKLSGPTTSSNWWGEHGNDLSGKSASHDFYDTNQGFFNGPGQGSSWLDKNSSRFSNPGAAEDYWNSTKGKLSQPSTVQSYFDSTKSQFTGPGAAEDAYSKYGGKLFSGDNELKDNAWRVNRETNSAHGIDSFMGRTWGDYENPGYSEDLYKEGNTGLNRYYDRAYQQGSRRIGEESAARGGYNSGASLRATEELNTDLGAQQARDMAALADQADRTKMARLSLGLQGWKAGDETALGRAGMTRGLYGDIADKSLNRMQLGAQMAKDAQGLQIQRLLAGGKISKDAADALMDQIRLGGDLAKTAEGFDMDRLFKEGEFAFKGGEEDLARKGLGLDAAKGADSADVTRFSATGDAARGVDSANVEQTNALVDAGYKSDQTDVDKAMASGDLVGKGEGMTSKRYETGADIAMNVDTGEQARVAGGQVGATGAQTLEEKRLGDEFDRILALAKAQGDTYAAQRGEALQSEWQQQLAAIDGLLKSGAIDAETAAQKRADLTAQYTLFLQSLASAAPPRTSTSPTTTTTPTSSRPSLADEYEEWKKTHGG